MGRFVEALGKLADQILEEDRMNAKRRSQGQQPYNAAQREADTARPAHGTPAAAPSEKPHRDLLRRLRAPMWSVEPVDLQEIARLAADAIDQLARELAEAKNRLWHMEAELNGARALSSAPVSATGATGKLVALAVWTLEQMRGENIGNDLDGGSFQDKAESLGILHWVEVSEPCGEVCACAEYDGFPQQCLRYTAETKAAVDRTTSKEQP